MRRFARTAEVARVRKQLSHLPGNAEDLQAALEENSIHTPSDQLAWCARLYHMMLAEKQRSEREIVRLCSSDAEAACCSDTPNLDAGSYRAWIQREIHDPDEFACVMESLMEQTSASAACNLPRDLAQLVWKFIWTPPEPDWLDFLVSFPFTAAYGSVELHTWIHQNDGSNWRAIPHIIRLLENRFSAVSRHFPCIKGNDDDDNNNNRTSASAPLDDPFQHILSRLCDCILMGSSAAEYPSSLRNLGDQFHTYSGQVHPEPLSFSLDDDDGKMSTRPTFLLPIIHNERSLRWVVLFRMIPSKPDACMLMRFEFPMDAFSQAAGPCPSTYYLDEVSRKSPLGEQGREWSNRNLFNETLLVNVAR